MTEQKVKTPIMSFINTISAGNILTVISMSLAGGAAWMNMAERVSRVEQSQTSSREADARHEAELRIIKSDNREVLLEIKADIKEMRKEIQHQRK